MSRADELRDRLTAFCASRTGRDVVVDDLSRLSGGASRETWTFVLSDGEHDRRLVLRRDPPGAPGSSDRWTEAEVLSRAAAAGVPVPEVLWTGDAAELGSPGFVMAHVEGETIARKILRDDAYAAARPVLAEQCGEILARIHATPADGITGLAAPEASPAEAVVRQYAELLESLGEPHPAFELALRWLSGRMPEPVAATLVHGDFRIGNLIVGGDGVAAVLDWELVHVGDPREDLAWLCTRSWRFGGDGEVGGFGRRRDLYDAYAKASGAPVDEAAVHWWEVMSSVKWGVMTIVQAFTHLWGHVHSLELAAIGRRTVETEYDVLRLIGA